MQHTELSPALPLPLAIRRTWMSDFEREKPEGSKQGIFTCNELARSLSPSAPSAPTMDAHLHKTRTNP